MSPFTQVLEELITGGIIPKSDTHCFTHVTKSTCFHGLEKGSQGGTLTILARDTIRHPVRGTRLENLMQALTVFMPA